MKSTYESEALDLVLHYLKDRGQNPEDIRYPDEDNRDSSDVDVEFRLGLEIWNLEHTRFTFSDRVPSNSKAVSELARPALEKIALEAGVKLVVAFCADFESGPRDAVKNIVEDLTVAAKQAVDKEIGVVVGQSDALPNDSAVDILISKDLSRENITFYWFLSQSADIGMQTRDFLLNHVSRKIRLQLGPYRERGNKTGLIIDQRPDPNPTRKQSSFSPTSDQTIPAALTEVGSELPFRPDIVFMISNTAQVSEFRFQI